MPRYVELKGDKSERVTLDPIAVADGPSWSGFAAFRWPTPAR